MTGLETFPYLVKTISAFAVVVGIMIAAVYMIKRVVTRTGGHLNGDDVIKIVALRHVGPKMSIMILDVLGRLLVVGVSPQQISLLADCDDDESVNKMKDMRKKGKEIVPFREHLLRFRSKILPRGPVMEEGAVKDA